ncbi:Osmotin thaumatin-like protein [Vararia minispora EC-137]|uniref:Osmotin thaumatin-like protein n=1 Tax=Vararia minispora EC-137 TaxID=1314806 RepID=A0ACB8QAW4_9AGAM|nr:Osmotin thaumatin-like protein [Vararia minispora EC-137]
MKYTLFALALTAGSTSAFTLNFVNNCGYTIWPAIGAAPNGSPNPSIAYGTTLGQGGFASFGISDTAIGVRAWGRTGCDSNGANCATGNCNGGLVCTDGGITSGVLLSEFGYANFGPNFGGERTSWDLSHVSASINIPTRLSVSDGQSVTCTPSSCPPDQAYDSPTDYAADRNSALGQTYTHTFCP